jgi:hypothetical protein
MEVWPTSVMSFHSFAAGHIQELLCSLFRDYHVGLAHYMQCWSGVWLVEYSLGLFSSRPKEPRYFDAELAIESSAQYSIRGSEHTMVDGEAGHSRETAGKYGVAQAQVLIRQGVRG